MNMFKWLLVPVVLGLLTGAPASAQDTLPGPVRSNAFVQVVAERGLECGLLKPWQSAVLRALVQQDMNGWDAERRGQMITATADLAAQTGCESESMTGWIEGASRGFEVEMLAPYLAAYKGLAQMDPPPKAFAYVALRLDPVPVVEMIDAKLAEFAASGRQAEGGLSWPEFETRTARFVEGFAEALSTNTGGAETDLAAAWLAQTAHIVELWVENP